MPTQARLLRVLESGEFIKVGSSKVQKTDVRIVAATNVNLTQAIAEGRFREDLYTVPIQIPPLRERGDDVLLLFRKFAADFAAKYRMPAIQLTEDAKKELLAYPWPGNVRQLKNITEQISIIETNREITAAILQTYLPAQNVQRLPALLGTRESKSFESEREILYSVLFDMRQEVAELRKMVHNMMAERAGQVAQMGQVGQVVATPVVTTANQPSVPAIIHPMQQATVCPKDDDDDIQDTEEYVEENLALDEVEKEMIRKALEKHHGKRKGAARDLKISERTLYRKIKEYELDYLHRISEAVRLEDVATVMGRLIQEGLIRGWGLSQVSADQIRAAHKITPLSAVQNIYSMVERDCETEIFPVCLEKGIGVVPFSPIASGFLSGKVTAQEQFGFDDVRKFVPQLSKENIEANQPILDLLHRFAVEKKATNAQISLAWMLHKYPNVVPMPGSKNQERILENQGAWNVTLSDDEFRQLQSALDECKVHGHRGCVETEQTSFGKQWSEETDK